MNFFRTGKLRWLYLLALVQLVGGPLVLLQVTVFCKLALREAPSVGVAKAALSAWHSEDFQAVIADVVVVKNDESKSHAPSEKSKVELGKSKLDAAPWAVTSLSFGCLSSYCKVVDLGEMWTPAWPQAPPGPPPRVG